MKGEVAVDFASMVQRAIQVRCLYDAENTRLDRPSWNSGEYLQGFMADLGALSKLVMAHNGLREADQLDQRLAHELADCLWSVIVLADKLEVDLEAAFLTTMTQQETRFTESTAQATDSVSRKECAEHDQ